MVERFGWVRDLPDRRDFVVVHPKAARLPASVSLLAGMPPVYDQLDLGSCVGNALAAAVDYTRKKQGLRFMTPSRLFIYWNARSMEQSTASDSGCAIRDAMKTLINQGVCVEAEWPYSEDFSHQPSILAYQTATRHETLKYESPLQNLANLKAGLAAGFPFVFGFSVYESFMSGAVAATGLVPMPIGSESMVGGHAVAACGYDDLTGDQIFTHRPEVPSFLVRNSWGASWGINGYFWLPYTYILDPNLADDFWQIDLE